MHRDITFLDYVITVHASAYDLRAIRFVFGEEIAPGQRRDVDKLCIEEVYEYERERRKIYDIDMPSSRNQGVLCALLDELFAGFP